jgi:hypothetical protein
VGKINTYDLNNNKFIISLPIRQRN